MVLLPEMYLLPTTVQLQGTGHHPVPLGKWYRVIVITQLQGEVSIDVNVLYYDCYIRICTYYYICIYTNGVCASCKWCKTASGML